MKPLLFLLRKRIKNQITDLRKKPAALAGYVIAALFIILMIAVSFFTPSSLLRKGSSEAFGAVVTAGVLAFSYFSIKQGINKGSSFFRLSDVNLVFTSPISPKKVLVYGFIQQLILSFAVVLFVSIQIPNLKNNFPVTRIGILIIYIGVFFLFLTMQLAGMLIYSFTSRTKRIRTFINKVLNVIIVLLMFGFLTVVFQTKDLVKAAIICLNNPVIDYIPLIGWFRVILLFAVQEIQPAFYLNLILVLSSIITMSLFYYKTKTDYYEDVLEATELNEQKRRSKKEGKVNAKLMAKNLRKVQFKYIGTGAIAIFEKHILEYKKTGWFFLNKFSFIMVAFGLSSKYFFSNSSIRTVLYFTIYILFLFSIRGKWTQELDKPYIYLIPSSSGSKVFYATLAENLKNGVDGLILFIAAGFLFKTSILVIILCALCYMSFGAVYIYGNVLSSRLFGEVHSKNLRVFIKMFMILFVLIPGLVASIAVSIVFANTPLGEYGSYLILLVYNITAAAIILLLAKGIFEKLEMR